jgi:hypothetical protein
VRVPARVGGGLSKNLERQKLLQFFGQSSNGRNKVAQLTTAAQLEACPVWDPEKT